MKNNKQLFTGIGPLTLGFEWANDWVWYIKDYETVLDQIIVS